MQGRIADSNSSTDKLLNSSAYLSKSGDPTFKESRDLNVKSTGLNVKDSTDLKVRESGDLSVKETVDLNVQRSNNRSHLETEPHDSGISSTVSNNFQVILVSFSFSVIFFF